MNIKKSEKKKFLEIIYGGADLRNAKTCYDKDLLTYLCEKRMLKHTYVSFSSEARLAMLQYFVARFYLAFCLGRQNIHLVKYEKLQLQLEHPGLYITSSASKMNCLPKIKSLSQAFKLISISKSF